jgi:hypothetical protein
MEDTETLYDNTSVVIKMKHKIDTENPLAVCGGVRQGCRLCSLLFDLETHEVLEEFKVIHLNRIPRGNNEFINSILIVIDRVLLTK